MINIHPFEGCINNESHLHYIQSGQKIILNKIYIETHNYYYLHRITI